MNISKKSVYTLCISWSRGYIYIYQSISRYIYMYIYKWYKWYILTMRVLYSTLLSHQPSLFCLSINNYPEPRISRKPLNYKSYEKPTSSISLQLYLRNLTAPLRIPLLDLPYYIVDGKMPCRRQYQSSRYSTYASERS